MRLSDIPILKIKNSDYHCIISGISRCKAIKLFQNIDLAKKKVKHYKNLLKIMVLNCF